MAPPKDGNTALFAEPTAADDAVERVGRLAELGLMAATLAHEQRQPLFAIKSLAQILIRRSDSATLPMLEQLLEQVILMERIIDGIGVYSRNPAEQLAPVDLAPVVQGALEMMGHYARTLGVELRALIEGDLGAARGDSTALTQVLVNLVRNALDASPRGSVVLVRAETRGAKLVLEVQDEGPGVPELLRERIFEAFFTTKAPGQGTGLGLSISRQLVEDLGGTLTLPDCERGLCVRVCLEPWRRPLDVERSGT